MARRHAELRMYSRVDWMMPVDMAILGLLAPPKPLKLTPGNIAVNIEYSRGHVSKRCRVLVDNGLLSVEENGDPYFSITDLGRQVVDREVDPSVLQES